MKVEEVFAVVVETAKDREVRNLIKTASQTSSLPSFYRKSTLAKRGLTAPNGHRWTIINPANKEVITSGNRLAATYPMKEVYLALRKAGKLSLIPQPILKKTVFFTAASFYSEQKLVPTLENHQRILEEKKELTDDMRTFAE